MHNTNLAQYIIGHNQPVSTTVRGNRGGLLYSMFSIMYVLVHYKMHSTTFMFMLASKYFNCNVMYTINQSQSQQAETDSPISHIVGVLAFTLVF